MIQVVPQEVSDVLSEYCKARRSGSVVLDIKDGRVLQIRATTTTAVAKVDKRKGSLTSVK